MKMLTTTMVAKRLGIAVNTARGMLEAGSFAGAWRTAGGHWRVPEHVVDAWLQSTRPFVRRRKESA